MNVFKKTGELALGSRLKRLSDYIMKEGHEIYLSNGFDFEPRWFPIYYLISEEEGKSVMDIATETGFKHPTVSQFVKEMEQKDILSSEVDKNDGRKKLIFLGKEGESLLPKLKPLWSDIAQTMHEVAQNYQHQILPAVEWLENSFEQEDFHSLVRKTTKKRLYEEVDIIPFEASLSKYFADLNYEWIEKYFVIEDIDREVLENPVKLIKEGGAIFFAKVKEKIVGTCALKNLGKHVYELTKMGVTPEAQGRQVGKKLGLVAIDKAKDLGAIKLVLDSNRKLIPAIKLYYQLGFNEVHEEQQQSAYERCNISMEMTL
ncbi:MAG: bifunctional helix-turn-helix transcriptional regulator/GNAT family N-acetyltransferase [Bacteroidota bacterium]